MEYRDHVKVAKKSGKDDPWSGSASAPEEKPYRCRISYESRLVKDQNGNEVVSNVHIRFPGAVEIDYADEVIWKDLTGVERRGQPIHFKIPRDTNYRPLMTVVDL